MKKEIQKLLLFTCLTGIFNAHATTYYVTSNGAGLINGSSWADAFDGTSLQAAISAASVGDEVWVAAGTYVTTTGTNRSVSFNMKTGVTIYGSFVGTETSISERTLTNGLSSILSGEIGNAGIDDNSYTVVWNELLDDTAILDGFVIRDANDDRSPSSDGNGLGGGIYNHGYGNTGMCNPIIKNCLFEQNSASWGGGAFNNGYNGGNSEPTYINCIFYQNHAYIEAGGMDSYGVGGNASPTLYNSIFYENTSATNVGGMFAWGGNTGGNSHPLLINCVFANNSALNGYAGAFIANSLDENGSSSSGSSTVTLQNCIVWNNTATGDGPQFYARGTNSEIVATYSNIDLTGQTAPHIISGLGTGNISSNPLFTNINLGLGNDAIWMTSDDGLQLANASPSLNRGLNDVALPFDLLLNDRIKNDFVDMGAYENQSPFLATSTNDQNGIININLYPNPSSGDFFIEINPNLRNQTYKIVNTMGQTVKTGELTANQNNISFQQKSGIYILIVAGHTIHTIIK